MTCPKSHEERAESRFDPGGGSHCLLSPWVPAYCPWRFNIMSGLILITTLQGWYYYPMYPYIVAEGVGAQRGRWSSWGRPAWVCDISIQDLLLPWPWLGDFCLLSAFIQYKEVLPLMAFMTSAIGKLPLRASWNLSPLSSGPQGPHRAS